MRGWTLGQLSFISGQNRNWTHTASGRSTRHVSKFDSSLCSDLDQDRTGRKFLYRVSLQKDITDLFISSAGLTYQPPTVVWLDENP